NASARTCSELEHSTRTKRSPTESWTACGSLLRGRLHRRGKVPFGHEGGGPGHGTERPKPADGHGTVGSAGHDHGGGGGGRRRPRGRRGHHTQLSRAPRPRRGYADHRHHQGHGGHARNGMTAAYGRHPEGSSLPRCTITDVAFTVATAGTPGARPN